MKKQNGFISSSSSTSVKYTMQLDNAILNQTVTSNTITFSSAPYTTLSQLYSNYSTSAGFSWVSCATTCYERLESFLEATEKIGEPLSKNSYHYQNLYNYSAALVKESSNIYNGFIDVVITLPFVTRLAGIELINPWVSSRFGSEYSSYWMYLPVKFNIYKVNHEMSNSYSLKSLTYEDDVAKISYFENDADQIRPIKYNKLDYDDNMTLLGTYNNINWKNLPSKKCFFKYNLNDPISQQAKNNIESEILGTATWECKQLVIRIFETKKKISHLNIDDPEAAGSDSYIKNLIYDYIVDQETAYGTKYAGKDLSREVVKSLIDVKEEFSSIYNPTGDPQWSFGGEFLRSYYQIKDIKFKAGINYKLGGIQLLFSPDVFSISEMKMYNYYGKKLNKVYIGEYDPEYDDVYFYGAKTIKQSPYFDIDEKTALITWRHSFNIPANYLEAKIYIRFNMAYGDFNVGDVIENVVNIQNAPLSIKVTDNEVSVNLSNGVGFLNPITGEFMSFKNGIGFQMDRPGNYEALGAALDVGANIIDAGSSVAATITGGCPFQLYFVIKRLF